MINKYTSCIEYMNGCYFCKRVIISAHIVISILHFYLYFNLML